MEEKKGKLSRISSQVSRDSFRQRCRRDYCPQSRTDASLKPLLKGSLWNHSQDYHKNPGSSFLSSFHSSEFFFSSPFFPSFVSPFIPPSSLTLHTSKNPELGRNDSLRFIYDLQNAPAPRNYLANLAVSIQFLSSCTETSLESSRIPMNPQESLKKSPRIPKNHQKIPKNPQESSKKSPRIPKNPQESSNIPKNPQESSNIPKNPQESSKILKHLEAS